MEAFLPPMRLTELLLPFHGHPRSHLHLRYEFHATRCAAALPILFSAYC
jgi:hypothetical protein